MKSVLDHGFVRYVDHMGSDDSICDAARVSYQVGTTQVRDNQSLIRYLWRNEHSSPFEHAELIFHIKAPIFVARQWFRHRSASPNEWSGRYSEMPRDTYTPDLNRLGQQSETNRQGTGELLDVKLASKVQDNLRTGAHAAFSEYDWLLREGNVSREMARINLPLSTYTEFRWKQNLRNMLHLLHLRLDGHAQWEIQEYARAMSSFVKELFPLTWGAFEDYTLNSIRFSAMEKELLKELLEGGTPLPHERMSTREFAEFWDKIQALKT